MIANMSVVSEDKSDEDDEEDEEEERSSSGVLNNDFTFSIFSLKCVSSFIIGGLINFSFSPQQ